MFQRVPTQYSIDYINNASEAKLIVLYKKVLKKMKMCNNHLWFNKQCLQHNIIPHYVKMKCKNQSNSAIIAIKKAQIVWLKEELKRWYSERYFLNLHLKIIHCKLANQLHNIEFDILDKQIRMDVTKICFVHYRSQLKKLNYMKNKTFEINKQTPEKNPPQFHSRVKNLTTTNFNKEETRILNNGLNFAPHMTPSVKDFQNLAIDTEVAISTSTRDNFQKTVCAKIIKKQYNKSVNSVHHKKRDCDVIKSIKRKIKNNSLILCKADKGNTITILNKSDYINKVNDFISENNLTELNFDPTNKYQKQVKTVINSCQIVLKNKYRLINPNPSAPDLYGLPKIHKNNIPIRPVVSYINAPSYNLCKQLNTILREHLKFEPKYTVKNSLELIQKINSHEYFPRAKLVSFDICSLFTSVPINQVKEIISKKLTATNVIVKNEILDLLEICLDQNYFKFNGKVYKQNDGLPMGSPLSPLLADIFMNELEVELLTKNKNPFSNSIKWWFRYVDDILCLWSGTDRQLDKFLTHLNTLNKNIKFTIEKEQDAKLNFLDLTLIRETNKFEFNIFRKPTFSDTVIPNCSNHPINIKKSAFNSMIHRLVNIPLSKHNFQTELNTIYHIAHNNGYNKEFVDKILHKKQKQFILKQIYYPKQKQTEDTVYRRIPYLNNCSLIIRNELKRNNIIASFYNDNKLKNLLVNNKLKTRDKMLNSGVYQINCDDCDSIYIGKTFRKFETRFKEHIDSFKKGKTNLSNVAKHLVQNAHNCNNLNFKILHVQNKSLKLDLLEAMEIQKAVHTGAALMNEQLDLNKSPLLSIP